MKDRFIPTPNPNDFIDHASHAKPGIWPFPDRLHVVTAIINPQRFRSRYELYRAFQKRTEDAGAILHTVEVAFGGRPFEVTEPSNPNNLQLRIAYQELWHKENALNVLIADVLRRHPEAKYFAWIDADVQFSRPDWAQETLHQLQHYHVVQMFSMCQDLNIDHEVLAFDDGGEQLPGMIHQYVQAGRYGKFAPGAAVDLATAVNRTPPKPEPCPCCRHCPCHCPDPWDPYYQAGVFRGRLQFHPGHAGYAWAATRYALDTLGGLIDWSVCGANDHHMARAFIGDINMSVHKDAPERFKASLRTWGDRAELLKPKIGYMPGLVTHFWHGPKANRQYRTRWQILNENHFDPQLDLKRDAQGLYQLTGRNKKLVADLMAYFRQRNEDSTGL